MNTFWKWLLRFIFEDGGFVGAEEGNETETATETQTETETEEETTETTETTETQETTEEKPQTFKVGGKEIPVDELVGKLDTLDKMIPIVEALAKGEMPKGFKPKEPEKKIDPTDLQGRLDQIEMDNRERQNQQEAQGVMDEFGKNTEGFDGDAALNLLMDAGMVYSSEGFKAQLELAHKALQYDAMKTDFDGKMKTAVETAVTEAIEKYKRGESANDVIGSKGKGAKHDRKDWEGDPMDVKERHFGPGNNKFGD